MKNSDPVRIFRHQQAQRRLGSLRAGNGRERPVVVLRKSPQRGIDVLQVALAAASFFSWPLFDRPLRKSVNTMKGITATRNNSSSRKTPRVERIAQPDAWFVQSQFVCSSGPTQWQKNSFFFTDSVLNKRIADFIAALLFFKIFPEGKKKPG